MVRMTGKTSTVVTLFGLKLKSAAPGAFVLDVEPRMGDAERFGLGGQITFLNRQCAEDPSVAGEYWIVRIPTHIAQLKSELAGNVRKKKRGR